MLQQSGMGAVSVLSSALILHKSWLNFWIKSKIRLKSETGGLLNKKDGLTRCGDSHVKDKTSYRPSYL